MNLKIKIDGKKINTVSETKICTFKEWGLTEESIENFVCDNLQLIFGEDTSYLLVGRQVKDKENKKNDAGICSLFHHETPRRVAHLWRFSHRQVHASGADQAGISAAFIKQDTRNRNGEHI